MKDRRDDSYGKFGKRDAEKKGKNKIKNENHYRNIADFKHCEATDQCLLINVMVKNMLEVCGY